MATDRTHDEVLDELVYAVQRAYTHYGPGFSADGLTSIRSALNTAVGLLWCDSSWRVDVPDGEEMDYHATLPVIDHGETFEECRDRSRTGNEDDA